MKRFFSVSLALVFAALACSPEISTPGTVTVKPTGSPMADIPSAGEVIPMQVGYGYRGPFYEIYFTDPFNPNAKLEEGGPDVPLAKAIDAARISVDMAAYSLSLDSIRYALIHAQERGVRVRLVMESDNMGSYVPQSLINAGIPIIGDRREGLMHDKFVVIDRSEVWTGSMNFTTSGTYEDNNNLVRIRSTKVAEDYTVEFEEMFDDDFFGPDAVAATPNPILTVDGTQLEVYFSPDDGIAKRVMELLRGAQHSIYFMAYSFTADDFGDIIRRKEKDGLTVFGVMEADQVSSNEGTEFDPFHAAEMKVFKDGNPGQMHHKVFIIDEKIVITGSYNFSASAERTNDENMAIFFDPQIAAQYLAEFQRVYFEAQKE
jgi:phosphatidylserine/phosphatidylglycerophosphate/cardiolipin synthase-like enzyme